MTFKFVSKLALLVLFGLTMFTSCTKDDSVTIAEKVTEEPLELQFKLTVNGQELITDAVAAYCQNDSTEFIVVANKQANLSFPLETGNFEEGDFTYFTNISDDGTTWGIGGQALGSSVTGFSGLSILFSDAQISIESNDGSTVVGSSDGILRGFDDQGNIVELPYSVDFVAQVVEESTFCD